MTAEPLIDLRHVTRRYGDVVALDDVTLRIPPGRVGLLGPNGAGKSTLLKLILGLIPPTSGTGTVLGQPLGRDHEVLTALELEEARYRPLEEYSLGMKQRIKLAQALVHDPPVLLLDEPTSGLDPAGREAMLQLLVSLGRDHGKSLILSTHLLGDVETVCEQVVILEGGKVRGHGSVRDLCARRHDRYRLQVQGDPTVFVEEMALEGVRVLFNNGRGELRVAAPDGFLTRAFFALADNHGVVLRGLERDDESLEEMFHRLVGGDPAAEVQESN